MTVFTFKAFSSFICSPICLCTSEAYVVNAMNPDQTAPSGFRSSLIRVHSVCFHSKNIRVHLNICNRVILDIFYKNKIMVHVLIFFVLFVTKIHTIKCLSALPQCINQITYLNQPSTSRSEGHRDSNLKFTFQGKRCVLSRLCCQCPCKWLLVSWIRCGT